MLISELCNDYFWIMPKTPRYVDGANIPYITSKNLKNGSINYKDCKYITEDAFKNLTSKRYIQEDDFLISMIGTIGEVGIVKKTDLPIYGQNMYLLRPNYALVNKRYLYNFITSTPVNTKLQNIINGATQGYLHDKDIINLFLVNRTLEEQAKIATQLDNIRNIIELKMQEINDLDELIKSRFIEMFAKYEKTNLCDIATITMGQSPDSKSYNDDGNGIPFFQGKADFGDKYTKVAHWTTEPSKNAKQGDVLMSVRAPVGPVNISSCDCCIGRGLCSISGIKGKTNNEFLYCALNAIQDDISQMGNGSTFHAITKNDVYKIQMPAAPIEFQHEFASFVKQIDKSKFVCYSKYFL
ncbi:MAG: restriction endonuclease subunit S [Candidatus Onthovivens sp.]|nr:restriction endonuclease subunit S [Bacilli bacterium]